MHPRRTLLTLAAALLAAAPLPAAQEAPAPIRDNSFLIEEAYNQEARVVQHIGVFERAKGGAWAFAFTQEWPMLGQRHQLSYSLPAESPAPGVRGIGDVALNYRYELTNTRRVTIAPRVSAVLPTGDWRRGLGLGGPGLEFNLPVSWTVSPRVVTHWNAGLGHTPSARHLAGRAPITSVTLGQSTILLAAPVFNVMLETLWSRENFASDFGAGADTETFVVSPGARYAINRGGTQIVPGIAVPIGVGPSRGLTSLIFYLSVEHGY